MARPPVLLDYNNVLLVLIHVANIKIINRLYIAYEKKETSWKLWFDILFKCNSIIGYIRGYMMCWQLANYYIQIWPGPEFPSILNLTLCETRFWWSDTYKYPIWETGADETTSAWNNTLSETTPRPEQMDTVRTIGINAF